MSPLPLPPHVPSLQHGWPAAPHEAQTPFWQIVLGAVHPLGQHDSPAAPQPPQLPLSQTPPSVNAHTIVGAAQTPETQHPPPTHVLALQHESPPSPHPVQIPASTRQMAPAEQAPASQQLSPADPQATHTFATHEPAVQPPPSQQAPRRSPHVAESPSVAASPSPIALPSTTVTLVSFTDVSVPVALSVGVALSPPSTVASGVVPPASIGGRLGSGSWQAESPSEVAIGAARATAARTDRTCERMTGRPDASAGWTPGRGQSVMSAACP
jgi:hypothetical protein